METARARDGCHARGIVQYFFSRGTNRRKRTGVVRCAGRLEQAVIGQYLEYLEKRGIRREDLAVILDTLIATGNVSYSCKILGRIEIELVMRSTAMNESITRRLDEEFAGRQDVSVMRYSNPPGYS